MKQLCFDLRSWWHAGSGRGTGSLVDAVVVKDVRGLPILPGRTVKGLVREAVFKMEDWGLLKPLGVTEALFGSATHFGDIHPNDTVAGLFGFGNATLPAAIQPWLGHEENKAVLQALFGELHSTRIGAQTGRAKNQSLRAMEVTVPLKLYAPVTLQGENGDHWNILESALPLVRGLGQSRHRGLGRVHVTLREGGDDED